MLVRVDPHDMSDQAGARLFLVSRATQQRVPLDGMLPGTMDACSTGRRFAIDLGKERYAGPYDLGLYDVADGSLELARLPGLNLFPRFGPSCTQLAFLHLPWGTVPAGDMGHGIWTLNTASGKCSKISHPTGSAERNETDAFPYWSSDGERIAFRRIVVFGLSDRRQEGDLWLARADGSGERRLTRLGDVEENPVAWSDDGRNVAFVRAARRPGPTGSEARVSLWSVDIRDDSLRAVLSWDQLHHPQFADDLAISPGCARVATLGRHSEWSETHSLRIVEVASGASTLVDVGGNLGPLAWSADGSELAYARDGDEIWIASKDTDWRRERFWAMPDSDP